MNETVTASGRFAEVLVVEDDPLSRHMLVRMLESADIRAESACDGQEAVERIRDRGEAAFEIVFTDVRMPRMGGLELLEWLNTHAPTTATVVMTGNQDRDLVSASLRGGAVEFIDKPFELRAIFRAVRRGREAHRERSRQRDAARRLLDIADIHQRLTRTDLARVTGLADRLRATTRFYAMNEAGGDLVKTARLGPERILVVVGDVSGHGLREGFLSAYFQGIIEGMATHAGGGRSIAEAFNRFLRDQWNDADPLAVATSLAACFVEIDLGTRRVSVINCGGPGVVLGDADGISVLAPGGSPLGWFSDLEPAEASAELPLEGALWLWSDGLEAHAARISTPPLALAAAIVGAPPHSLADSLLGGADDDIVVCRVDWVAPAGSDPARERVFHQVDFAGDAGSAIDAIQAGLDRVLRIYPPDLSASIRHDVGLCLREALINAFLHGCAGDPARRVRLILSVAKNDRSLIARVADDGPGFDPAAPRPPADPEHISLGLNLIRSLAASAVHSPDGRVFRLVFPLAASLP